MVIAQIGETIVDTDRATETYEGEWEGDCYKSKTTLYRSSKGRYYTRTVSNVQNSNDRVRWATDQEVVRFLALNQYDIPDELQAVAESVVE